MSISNSEFEALLRKCFTPIELYPLIIQCYGSEVFIEPPQLAVQENIYFEVTQAIWGKKVNRYFLEEFRRCRPQYYEVIEEMANEQGTPLRPMRNFPTLADPPLGMPIFTLHDSRFLAMSQRKKGEAVEIYRGWDTVENKEVIILISHQKDQELMNACYEVLMTMANLPHQNVSDVQDVSLNQQKQLCVISDSIESSHGFIKDSDEAISVLTQLGRALDAGHQRDILHGGVLPHHVFWDQDNNVVLGGFGEFLLYEESSSELEDYRSLFSWLSTLWKGESNQIQQLLNFAKQPTFQIESFDDLLLLLQSDLTEEVVLEENQASKTKGIMKVESPDTIRMKSWFTDGKKVITLRNLGDGLLPVHITTDQPWLKVVQDRPLPRRLSQKIDILFLHKEMSEVKGEGRIRFEGPDGQEKIILVKAQKAYWLWPAIFGFVAVLFLVWMLT